MHTYKLNNLVVTEMTWEEYKKKKMSKIYIGIDPDLIKSGVAFWFKDQKHLELKLMTTTQIILELKFMADLSSDFEVILEAGWLNKKSNFRQTQNKAVGERIAKNVGENHATGKIIEQACQELEITYRLVRPTKTKVNKTYFFNLTGQKVASSELRDAGMLVYGI